MKELVSISLFFPQLKQVQYDTSSQLYYVILFMRKFGFSNFDTHGKSKLFTRDLVVEEILASLPEVPNKMIYGHKNPGLIAYSIANRLGLYDAADVLRPKTFDMEFPNG